MDDHRSAALTDDALERDIVRAFAVEPSPEFLARVRTRLAEEPEPTAWRISWRAVCFAGGPVVAAALVLAVVLMRPDRAPAPVVRGALAARSIGGTVAIPYAGSGFLTAEASAKAVSRTISAPRKSLGPPKGGPHVPVLLDVPALLDPRESRALRSLIAGVRDNRVDLTPLLRPGAPAPMELPPVDDLVIAPIAIEPIAPQSGAQGERP